MTLYQVNTTVRNAEAAALAAVAVEAPNARAARKAVEAKGLEVRAIFRVRVSEP